MRPKEVLYPYTPHQAAGMRIDPPPSVPSASGSSPSATAAALPPEEPPVFLAVSKGLRLGANRELSQVPRNPLLGLPSPLAGIIKAQVDQGVQAVVSGLDALDAGLHDLDRGQLPPPDPTRQ